MNLVEKGNHMLMKIFPDSADTFFARTIDDVLASNFFDSFDANIIEQRDSYRLEIAVPGLTRGDLTIDVDGRTMSVSTRRVEHRAWRKIEFRKHVQRSFVLPIDADVNNIKAKCRHGLLTIHIGKIKRQGLHKVIQVSGGEPGSTARERITSWWTRLQDRSSRLLNRKRDQGR